MFIKELGDTDKEWEFTLTNDEKLVGRIVGHTMNVYGELLMVQINGKSGVKDIPWHAVVYLNPPGGRQF